MTRSKQAESQTEATTASAERRRMSDAHKAALAEGREQGRVVRRYLECLEQQSKVGRGRSRGSIEARLQAIEEELSKSDPVSRLMLLQERIDLTFRLMTMNDDDDIGAAERAFVQHARAYSERKGISYAAWRQIGVSASVLREAGIQRSGSTRT